MVWGGIGFPCRTPPVRVAGTLISQRYISEVMDFLFLPYIQCLPSTIFQQDTDQPRVARNVQEFLFNHQIESIPWSACSPDLSPIENLWSQLAQRLIRDTLTAATPDQLSSMWKPHGLMYLKDTTKASSILCQGLWQLL
ncbi:transposable element Tcb1 transposase [Trichonephila clavipes]|nr:transposable element Tcb1 transposase [Trichonephila clavipes]